MSLTDEQIERITAEHRRNALGRVVTHAEQILGLKTTDKKTLESLFPEDYERQCEFLERRLLELGGIKMTPAYFGFDEGPVWIGMHDGSTWNGWAMPYFTKEVADKIIAFFNETKAEAEEPDSRYIEAEDAYLFGYDEYNYPEDYARDPAAFLWRKNAKLGLYPLGTGSLTWNLVEGEELKDRLAEMQTEENDK